MYPITNIVFVSTGWSDEESHGKKKEGIQWGLQDSLEDLDFAYDICLLSQRYRDMEIKLVKLQREAENA
jgi:hypothetical protein